MRLICGLVLFAFFAAFMGPHKVAAQNACGGEYEVRPGDTLSRIARRVYNINDALKIYRVNVDRIGNDPNRIEIGTRLRLPCNLDAPLPAATDVDQANFQPAPDLPQPEAVDDADTALTDEGDSPTETAFVTSPDQPRVEIVFNKASAPKFIMNVGIIDPLFADIERVTQGRVVFKDPETVNRDPRVQYELVTSGQVDGAYMFNGYLSDSHPLVQITMQPMIGGTAQQTAIALWRVHDQHFRAAENFGDVHLLGFIGAPPAHIWRASDVPVSEREQLTNNNAWSIPYFDGLDTKGAKAVRAENAERIRLLDETPGLPPATYALAHGAARAVGVWSDARTVTEIEGGVYAPTFSLFISKQKWAEIGPADRKAIQGLLGESLAQRSTNWDAFDNKHKSEMLAQGLNIVQADLDLLAELQDQARLSWERWIVNADNQGISGFKAIEAFFSEMEQLRKEYPGG